MRRTTALALATLALYASGCQCGPARAGSRPLDGGGMDASGAFDAGDRDGSANDPDGSTADGGDRDGGGVDSGFVRPAEIYCDDGVDQDEDGDTDCADSDCEGAVCDPMGNLCRDGSCNGCRGEASETACGDGADEDCDGLRDCADPECDGAPCGPGGVVCAGGECPCPSGFNEWICYDGTDDDCDGLVDCMDPDCAMARCSDMNEICMSGTCACPSGLELCQAVDDDCDGVVDDGCPVAIGQGAPTTSSPAGASGDAAWVDACPMGMALVGMAGRASSRIDQLQPICAVVRFIADTSVTLAHPEHTFTVESGIPAMGAPHGGTGGTPFDDRCPTNQFVSSITGHAEFGLDSITLSCTSFVIERDGGFNWRFRQIPGATLPTRGGAGSGDFPFSHACGPNGVVTGVEGRAAMQVTSLATTCRTLSLDLR
ncbi:MAG: hypothetical protein KC619_02905 [Myxococcales bacterium]|nr:hypothetical protein [Myxococcales bacterium]